MQAGTPSDVFYLLAKLKFDSSEFTTGLTDSEKGFNGFSDKVKSGLGTIAKASGAAIAAASGAIGKVLSDSISAYGDYEQYVGGIEKLFGDSAETVIANANEAFKTAGLSASEYMETSINFSGALLKSLGGDTAAAADMVQTAITDMSDQANTYGKSVEQISETYTSLARGNFQTLDNLFGGMFAGTKAGLNEMLEYAENYRAGLGETVDYSADSYADIVSAIHDVSEATNVSGTTAKEAAGTLQGATGSLQAAWDNLKVEIVKDNGDIENSIETLLTSASTVFDNIEPRLLTGLNGVSAFIEQAAPQIAARLPEIIEKTVPPLLNAAGSLVFSVGKGIFNSLPGLLTASGDLASGFYNQFKQADFGAFSWLQDDSIQVIESLKGAFQGIDLENIFGSVSNYAESLNTAFQKVGEGFTWLTENVFSPLLEWGGNEVLPKVFDTLAASVDITTAALEFLETPAKAVWQEFLQPLANIAGDVISGSLDLISGALGTIADTVNGVEWEGFWIDLFSGDFGKNWKAGWEDIKRNIENAGDSIDEFFNVSEFGERWNKFWQGVGGDFSDVIETIKAVAKGFTDNFKLGLDSISDIIGRITDNLSKLKDGISGVFNGSIGEWVYDQTHSDSEPHLASGGIVTRPTRALIGEAGAEAVIPLENNTRFIDSIAALTATRTAGNSPINVTQNFSGAYIGSKEIAREIAQPMAEELQRIYNKGSRGLGGV